MTWYFWRHACRRANSARLSWIHDVTTPTQHRGVLPSIEPRATLNDWCVGFDINWRQRRLQQFWESSAVVVMRISNETSQTNSDQTGPGMVQVKLRKFVVTSCQHTSPTKRNYSKTFVRTSVILAVLNINRVPVANRNPRTRNVQFTVHYIQLLWQICAPFAIKFLLAHERAERHYSERRSMIPHIRSLGTQWRLVVGKFCAPG